MKLDLPTTFVNTIQCGFGEKGETWLANLPELIKEMETRWRLTVSPAFPNLSYNYVAPAIRQDGSAVVLKLGVPNEELSSEISALKIFAGRGSVRIFEGDPDKGALLLERLNPGRMLSTHLDAEGATNIAAEVMSALWRPEPAKHSFKSVSDWASGLEKIPALFPSGCPIPRKFIDQAKSLFTDLISSQKKKMLLHGDLHHFNILSSENSWRCIDPKGIIGEPEYETGAFLRNQIDPFDILPSLKQTEKRVDVFCEILGFDPKRVRAWAIAQAVLSAWWVVEDLGVEGMDLDYAIACAELFQRLKV
jgi:streptomycin 6-kinase